MPREHQVWGTRFRIARWIEDLARSINPPRSERIGDMTWWHVGTCIDLYGETVEVAEVLHNAGGTEIAYRRHGRLLRISVLYPEIYPLRVVDPAEQEQP